MKTQQLLSITLFFTVFIGFGQIPADYYDSAEGLTGYPLKTALKNIITNGHEDQGYGALYTAYLTTDTDQYYENDNSVLDMYSENPEGADAYTYDHDTNGGNDPGDACGSSGFSQESDCYNREHLFPQGFFNSLTPMRTDVHHVVPTDGYVNRGRGSFPFGEVDQTIIEEFTNGSKVGANVFPGYIGTVFEPIDEFKGDIARCLLYFATRYEDEAIEAASDGSGSWDPHTNDRNPMNGTTDQFYENWFVNLLISWHTADPVSQREIDRNNAAYDFQGNANPFISNPEFVEMIWTTTPPDTEAPTVPTDVRIVSAESDTIEISWTAATDNVAILEYDIYVDDVLFTTVNSTSALVSGLMPETTYDFAVLARDTSGNVSILSESVSGTTGLNTIIISEDFNDCDTVNTNFVAYNEASDKDWICETRFGQNDTGAYQINGFREDVPSRDWLITTNSIELTAFNNPTLSFYLDYRFGSTPLELVYSSDYTGSGDPTVASWIAVPGVSIPTDIVNSEEREVFLENIDLSVIQETVYFAFRYYSNGSPTRWTLDNFKIEFQNVLDVPSFDQNDLVVFPNPSQGNLAIKVGTKNIDEIAIFDISGKTVWMSKKSNLNALTIKNLPKGFLMLQATSGNQTVQKKLLVR